MTEQIKILESFKETFSGKDNINAIDTAIQSLKAWSKVLNELENMREDILQDTDADARIVQANAWDKVEILDKTIDIIKEHLAEQQHLKLWECIDIDEQRKEDVMANLELIRDTIEVIKELIGVYRF